MGNVEVAVGSALLRIIIPESQRAKLEATKTLEAYYAASGLIADARLKSVGP